MNDLLKAASCAYTFLTINPDHEVMRENLHYYVDELKVDQNYIVNIEAKAYVDFYIRGSDAYERKDYGRAANYMEMSLTEYLLSDEECRAHCEGPFDQGWFPDFISSISSNFSLNGNDDKIIYLFISIVFRSLHFYIEMQTIMYQ